MSIVELERQPRDGAASGTSPEGVGSAEGARSFESASRALLGELWAGRLVADSPEDRWLVGRIEEAVAGLDDIRAITGGENETAVAAVAEQEVRRASILAERSAVGT